MGLDITAYGKLTKLNVLFNADGEPVDAVTHELIEDYFQVFENQDFEGQIEGLEDKAVYSYENREHVFCRGYGGYGNWRETLAKLAGYPIDIYEAFGVKKELHSASAWSGKVKKGSPFFELINFSDCEGVIGHVVAKKLLRDFDEFNDRAKEIELHGFYEGYCEIWDGLKIAADGGALDFH